MPKQKDGRYRAKITVGQDTSGQPVVKYVSGKTKRELEENKAELRRVYREGLEDVRKDVLFQDYVMEWYEAYKKPSIGISSQAIYNAMIGGRIVPAFKDRRLQAIRPADLQKFLNSCGHLSKTSVRYITSILKNVFQRAVLDGVIQRDPTMGLIKTYATEAHKRALTDEEAQATLCVAETHKDGLLLLMLYYLGVRRGEALGAQWADIDFDAARIHIQRDIDFSTNEDGELKTEYSDRWIPIPDELFKVLQKMRGVGEAYILQSASGSFIGRSTFRRTWKRLQIAMYNYDNNIAAVDMEDGARGSVLTPHYYRHNYASVLYNAGVDVLTAQRYMGHKDARTTLAIYSHLSEQKELQGAVLLNDAFSKKVARKLPDAKVMGITQKSKSPKP